MQFWNDALSLSIHSISYNLSHIRTSILLFCNPKRWVVKYERLLKTILYITVMYQFLLKSHVEQKQDSDKQKRKKLSFWMYFSPWETVFQVLPHWFFSVLIQTMIKRSLRPHYTSGSSVCWPKQTIVFYFLCSQKAKKTSKWKAIFTEETIPYEIYSIVFFQFLSI